MVLHQQLSASFNHDILKIVYNYIKETDRFDRPLIFQNQWFFEFYYCLIFLMIIYIYIYNTEDIINLFTEWCSICTNRAIILWY